MVRNIDQWLEGLGLGKLSELFAENDIDWQVLPELDQQDLTELGLSLGHRKKLLKAIAALREHTSVVDQLPTSATATPPAHPEAERRQLTVMFCDLVGSTALSQRLDPEDLREVMGRYQDAVAGVITRYEGFVAKFLGDGVLAYFGWPQAHEDQAERSVRTGLDIISALAKIKLENNVTLEARIGIATGRVVVGELVGDTTVEAEAIAGETPNLAARLQGIAKPGQVVIGSLTRELVGETFELSDMGAHDLKGFVDAVRVWRVKQDGNIRSRYAAKHAGGELPLVGRQEELGLLIRSWEASKQAHGQVVLIQGEAGIGKSRLTEALRQNVSGDDYTWVAVRCSPYHTNSTLYPVIEHAKRVMNWKREESIQKRFEKLESTLGRQSLPLEEAVPLFAELMSLPQPKDRYATLGLSAKEQREQTLDALAGWQLEEAERKPLLALWEDLHWADPTTLELLELLIEQSPTVSMMNVLTYRPEFVPPWPMRSHMTPITLNRLERPEVEALIKHQANGKRVPSEVIEHIVDKTDGVPIYIEELTKSILESDYLDEDTDNYKLIGALSDVAIPATLQDSLMARLDRLPIMREIAQLGAAFGREFDYQMLLHLAPLEEAELQNGLGQLVANELLYQRGRPPRSRYIFKHALIQDAAYQSLLKRTRRQYHQQVAALLEERFPETVEAHPELVAHHYTEAAMIREAIDYWYLAGERARSQSANREAIAHLEKGISLTPQLKDEQDSILRELKLQFALGGAYLQMVGHFAPEVEVAFMRARELCLKVSDTPEMVPTLFGLWRTYVVRMADSDRPKQLAAELLRLAAEDGSAVSHVVAHYAAGFTAYVTGQLLDAQEHLQEGIRLYSSDDRNTASVYRFGQDPGVGCHCYLALTMWACGFPDKALQRSQEGMELARRLDDPFSIAFSLAITAFLDQACGDEKVTLMKAEQAVSLATEKGFPYWVGIGRVMQGWGEAAINPTQATIKEFKQQIELHRASGTDLFAPYFLGILGELAIKANQFDAAKLALVEAETVLTRAGERLWECEIHRLHGQLLLKQGKSSDNVEGRFSKALAVAQKSGAKSLELRAVVAIARLWQKRNKLREARELLAPVFDWFEEGVNTVDLIEAQTLLNELS